MVTQLEALSRQLRGRNEEITDIFRQDSQFIDRLLNPGPTDNESATAGT
jgi:hypothetical protein